MRMFLPLLLAACAPESSMIGPKGTPVLEEEAGADGDTDGETGEGSNDGDDGDDGDDGGAGSDPEPPAPCTLDDAGQLPASEGAFLAQDAPLVESRARCSGVHHATAAAGGSTLELALAQWPGSAWLTVTALDGAVLLEAELEQGDTAALEVPRSGELFVSVQPTDPDADGHPYELTATCTADCLPFTRYPIVLMHGMAGDDAWIGVFDYFVGVEDDLAEAGYLAIAPGVDAFNTVESRAAQWQAHLDALESEGVGRRFNLVGHSQGGLDARYLSGALGDARVVSITTVSTPHRGTSVASIATGALDATELGSWAADAVVDLLATIIGLGEAELTGQLRDLSQEEMERFNETVIDRPEVPIWSWGGRTCLRTDWSCLSDTGGEVTNIFFNLTTRIVDWAEGDNDGLVSVQSAQWGDFLGVLPADHIDSVGIHDPTATAPLDHKAFYRDEAARLAGEGL